MVSDVCCDFFSWPFPSLILTKLADLWSGEAKVEYSYLAQKGILSTDHKGKCVLVSYFLERECSLILGYKISVACSVSGLQDHVKSHKHKECDFLFNSHLILRLWEPSKVCDENRQCWFLALWLPPLLTSQTGKENLLNWSFQSSHMKLPYTHKIISLSWLVILSTLTPPGCHAEAFHITYYLSL